MSVRETEHRSCGEMFVMMPQRRARPLAQEYFETVCTCGKRWTIRAPLWRPLLPDCLECRPLPFF
jgi:hypothetical protein